MSAAESQNRYAPSTIGSRPLISVIRWLVLLSLNAALLGCDSADLVVDRESPEWLSGQLGLAVEAAIGPTRAELLRRWGTPQTAVLDTTSNLHVAGQIDTTATFRYDGLEVAYYVVSADGRELMTDVRLTRGGLLAQLPFDVGSSIGEVTEVLGSPTSETPSELRFGDEYDVMVLGTSGGRVSSIRYIFYVD